MQTLAAGIDLITNSPGGLYPLVVTCKSLRLISGFGRPCAAALPISRHQLVPGFGETSSGLYPKPAYVFGETLLSTSFEGRAISLTSFFLRSNETLNLVQGFKLYWAVRVLRWRVYPRFCTDNSRVMALDQYVRTGRACSHMFPQFSPLKCMIAMRCVLCSQLCVLRFPVVACLPTTHREKDAAAADADPCRGQRLFCLGRRYTHFRA